MAARAGRALPLLLVLAGTAAVFATQYSRVRATNFAGPDEWLCIDLASRGVLGTPYADRPLDLLWTAIPARAWPHELASYWLFHGLYLAGAGLVTALLAARLAPGQPAVALLAGVAACAWAPLDLMRLDAVVLTRYSGCTLAVVASLALFLASWTTGRLWPAVLGGGLGFLAALGFEGALPLLAAVPLVVRVLEGGRGRGGLARIAAWEAMVLAAAALTAPRALVLGETRYQASGLGFDPHPLRTALRLVHLLGLQIVPLATSDRSELLLPGVAPAVSVFAVAALAIGLACGEEDGGRPGVLRVAGLGAALAVLGALPFALSPATANASRTQLLSAPGVGLLLAGAAGLAGRVLTRRLRPLVPLLAGIWIVAVGTGRIAAMQREWDALSRYADQHRTLAGLVGLAPDVRPGTQFLLLDDAGAWPFSFSFRHAVRYLYAGRAIGLVAGANDILYPQRLGPDGVWTIPYASIRGAWDAPVSFAPWSSVVLVRLPVSGPPELVDRWPDGRLPQPSTESAYAPRERILPGGPLPSSRAVLRPPLVAR